MRNFANADPAATDGEESSATTRYVDHAHFSLAGNGFAMVKDSKASLSILVVVTPKFELAATVGFIDAFRAANYL